MNSRTQGYVLISGFLDSIQVEDLRTFYFSNYKGNFEGFHACMHSLDFDYRRRTNEKIALEFTKKTNDLLNNYRPLVGNYTRKRKR
jgi:hypothetical protein